MRLRFTTSIAGAHYAFTEGTVIEVASLEAREQGWLKSGVAVAERESPEVAVAPTAERAVLLPQRKTRRRRSAALAR